MKLVFADSQYYIGILHPRDQWHLNALDAANSLSNSQYITTEAVLGEVLAFFSDFGRDVRLNAAEAVQVILSDVNTEVLSVTPDMFREALALYKQRPDKSYSLTDCISMNICRERGITDVLSHDRHFSQEGLSVLM